MNQTTTIVITDDPEYIDLVSRSQALLAKCQAIIEQPLVNGLIASLENGAILSPQDFEIYLMLFFKANHRINEMRDEVFELVEELKAKETAVAMLTPGWNDHILRSYLHIIEQSLLAMEIFSQFSNRDVFNFKTMLQIISYPLLDYESLEDIKAHAERIKKYL